MPRITARNRASCITLAVIWQLVALIPSTHAQTELQSTQDDPSDACTRALQTNRSTGASAAHFPCLSFEPLSTTTDEETSSSPFSLSEQQASAALSAALSSFTIIPQTSNSTFDNVVSTSTIYTTLRGTVQATSTSTPDHDQVMTNGVLSPNGTAKTILSQNLTTGSESSMSTTSLPQDDDSATNATMFPLVLQTVTYTTTICPSGS